MADEITVYIDIDAFDPNEGGEPVQLKDVEIHPRDWSFPAITDQAVREANIRDLDYGDWEFSSEYK